MHKDICCIGVDCDLFKTIQDQMPEDEVIYTLADFFKVFGDSTRIKLIYALFNAEMCVGTIADLLDMSQSAVSHQLRVLKQNRLVKTRKEGKQVYYALNDEHVQLIFDQGLAHILEK